MTLNIGYTTIMIQNLYSHYSSSDFTINPYPKSNRNPDVLYHSTSSQGLNWKLNIAKNLYMMHKTETH